MGFTQYVVIADAALLAGAAVAAAKRSWRLAIAALAVLLTGAAVLVILWIRSPM